MEGSLRTPELDTRASTESKPETQASKRRKVIQKTVVTVKIEGNGGKQKNEGPPSDFWSWRKYGQKPIKGSPYPRGYYRCSTSKGCSAKKQVERCRTDASLLLITYTSSHNHPDPADPQNTTNLIQQHPKEPQTKPIEEIPTTPNQEQEQEPSPPPPPPPSSNNMNMVGSDEETVLSEDHFHYLQSSSKDMIIINPFTVVDHLEEENSHELLGLVFDEEPISYPHLMTSSFSTPTKSEENDFFDELEELPIITSSSFNSFMRSSLFDERVILQPS